MSDNTARRSWVLLTLGVLLVVAAMIGASRGSASGSTPTPPPRTTWMKTLCAQEDSWNCAWNAKTQGNDVGHSFYSVKRHLIGPHGHTLGRVVCVYYVKPADAKRWDACHLLPTKVHNSTDHVIAPTATATLTACQTQLAADQNKISAANGLAYSWASMDSASPGVTITARSAASQLLSALATQ